MLAGRVTGCLLLLTVLVVTYTHCCNDLVCGPIVTKCQLLKKCNIDIPEDKPMDLSKFDEDCPGCMECASCLNDKYPECCSCVGMCEPPETVLTSVNSSSVEDLREPIPGLFSALTSSDEASNEMWTVVRYPAHESLLHHKNFGVKVDLETNQVQYSWDSEVLSTVDMKNCSVAYVKDCLQLHKCKETCRSMGAARFRWFHDRGCCECIGDTCIDYGKNQPLCSRCSADHEPEVEEQEIEFDPE